MTSNRKVYIAGDVASIEEASSAMLEGTIAGISIAESLDCLDNDLELKREEANHNLFELRNGPFGNKINAGINRIEANDVI